MVNGGRLKESKIVFDEQDEQRSVSNFLPDGGGCPTWRDSLLMELVGFHAVLYRRLR